MVWYFDQNIIDFDQHFRDVDQNGWDFAQIFGNFYQNGRVSTIMVEICIDMFKILTDMFEVCDISKTSVLQSPKILIKVVHFWVE